VVVKRREVWTPTGVTTGRSTLAQWSTFRREVTAAKPWNVSIAAAAIVRTWLGNALTPDVMPVSEQHSLLRAIARLMTRRIVRNAA
jgi:hypothetical protein